MAVGRDEMRGVTGLLLVVNLVLYLIIIGLASWCFNQEIDLKLFNRHFGGNTATVFVLIYALLGGVIGASSVIAGFIHNRAWSRDSLGNATSTALISFAVTALAFGLVCKEIALGGYRGNILKTLEIVVIVSTFFQMLYLLLLHAGMYSSRYGPAYS
ncbi:membrane protein PM19L-like [Rhododendron vialii]|uniref:membrane protein PM19L-like n=1 Tax=Rhododendron vialii TaxID=182163 RepID=UPI00265E7D13|nr:membrane protein PM19L-like [Rhododendron vialii]